MLDVTTPRGQQTLRDEQKAVEIWSSYFPSFGYVHTKKDSDAACDAVIVHKNSVVAVVETKCRYGLTLSDFLKKMAGDWLVTYEKIEKCRRLAQSLRVKFLGFLYLVEEDLLLTETIADENGDFLPTIRIEKTATQKTVNGGQIIRSNAFIDMKAAKHYRRKDEGS